MFWWWSTVSARFVFSKSVFGTISIRQYGFGDAFLESMVSAIRVRQYCFGEYGFGNSVSASGFGKHVFEKMVSVRACQKGPASALKQKLAGTCGFGEECYGDRHL